jgi:hypothetical protein
MIIRRDLGLPSPRAISGLFLAEKTTVQIIHTCSEFARRLSETLFDGTFLL